MSFSNNLRLLIEEKDSTQKEVAAKLNIAPSTLGSYVQGVREPDYAMLKLLANYFNVSADYLLDIHSGAASTREEEELLRIFRSLTEEQRAVYLDQGKSFARARERK